jgi:D-alanyl-D-alanine carboxypeptidase (penicillin-binding protein 5/6)
MKMKRAGRKRQKGCLAIFLAGLFLWAAWGPAAWGEEPGGAETSTADVSLRLYAQSAVLMDGDSGRVLYEKDGYHSMPMASTTKIMTCILALENGNLDDMLTVSSYAASMPKVHLGVKAGERYRLEDLLYSLMLELSLIHI